MGRRYKFESKTVTISFRIPEDLFEAKGEYTDLRVILTDYIEKFYEEFKERKQFRERMRPDIHRWFRSFSEFTKKGEKV